MAGKMELRAKAKRQEWMNAIIKPVKKAAMQPTASATFSDIPCCTKSESNVTDADHHVN